MSTLLSFDDYCDLLVPVGALNSPAELHGMLCGRLCGGSRLLRADWLSLAWNFLDLVDEQETKIDQALEDSIAELYNGTLVQLQDESLSLQLLVPDDETDIGQRLQALSQWCYGFLTGFGSSGLSGDQTFSNESAEALRDYASIVQIGTDEDESEQSETDFFEVSEYVRLAAINMFLEFGLPKGQLIPGSPVIKPAADNGVLH